MIAEFGHFALVCALCVCLVQVGAGWPAQDDFRRSLRVADMSARAQFGLVLIAFGALTYSFVVSDFSLAVVHANSHIAKPLVYKIAGVWGNHEGSMLLWVLIWRSMVPPFHGVSAPCQPPARAYYWRPRADGHCFSGVFGADLQPVCPPRHGPFEGRGLTPILQDPALAAHPPLLYAGYVGFSIPFHLPLPRFWTARSTAVGALDAAMDPVGMGVFDPRHRAWIILGVLRAGLGWFLVLGSGGKRIAHAVAGRHCAVAFRACRRAARHIDQLDIAAGNFDFRFVVGRHVFGALRRSHLSARLC